MLVMASEGYRIKTLSFLGQLPHIKHSPSTECPHRTSAEDKERREMNSIVWDEVESHLFKAQADLFVIFDCCYAGDLAIRRSPSAGKIFSFLGSTQDNQTARGPGPRSFTTALIYALNQLVPRDDGFTVEELASKIASAPEFKDIDQRPASGLRGEEPQDRRLRIRRLPLSDAPNTTTEITKDQIGIGETQYLLRLNFAFSESPDAGHVSQFADGLSRLIQSSAIPIRQVTWGHLQRKTQDGGGPGSKAQSKR